MADKEVAEETVHQIPRTPTSIVIAGITFQAVETEVAKGRYKGKYQFLLDFDFSKPDCFADLRKAVGEENWNRIIYTEVIRPACNDATADATDANGAVSDVDWETKFRQWWIAATRRTDGGGVKQLREKRDEIMAELTPVLPELAKGNLTPGTPDHLRVLSLLADLEEVNSKIEARRKGRTKKTA